MDYELRAAKEKWEREQKEKKERARQRLERERKAKDEAAVRRQALEITQRQRRLEEAAAATSARQQEDEDLREGDGVVFRKVLTAVLGSGDGDKIRLPASSFEELSNQNALDRGPMFFEVTAACPLIESSRESGNLHVELDEEVAIETARIKATHAGVLEFTAAEGFVELPPHVWANSGLSEAVQTAARVRYMRLPKGTYAKLQAEGLDFAHVPNHKAVLETKLRQHTTLTVGDLLIVQHGGVSYDLRVLELKPRSQVSVLETDLEADILPPEQSGSSSQSRLVSLVFGKGTSGVVEQGQFNYYTFTIDQNLAAKVAAGEVGVVIHMQLDGEGHDSDADVYVAAHPILFPTQHQHQWSSHDLGSKVICLTSGNSILNSGTYSIGVYGFRGSAKYNISVEAKAIKEEKTRGHKLGSERNNTSSSGSAPSSSDFAQCGNCKQWIAIQTLPLHEAYCWRHNMVCIHPGCGVVLRKEQMNEHVHCEKCYEALRQEELEKHMKVFHEPTACSCGAMLEMKEMVVHQASVCPHRIITCQFCGDMVRAGNDAEDPRDRLRGLTQHESHCGSRTAECASCRRSVMLKEMDLHTAAAHSGAADGKINSSSVVQPQDARQLAPQAVAPSAVGNVVSSTQAPALPSLSVKCPICGMSYIGMNAESQLNAHLDAEHFSSNSRDAMDVDGVESSGLGAVDKPYPAQRSLSVSCPICGMAVHSERDLSSHIDMVH